MDVVLTVAVVVLVLLLAAAGAYNGLKSLRQDVRDAWRDMDEQLRRRYDLLAALASAARATGEPNPPPLAAAVAAKNRAAVAFNPQQLATAEAELTDGLRDLFRAPPASLAAGPTFGRLRADLMAVQTRIDQAARRYNDDVHAYNAALASFPHSWAAVAFGFKPQPMFELPPALPDRRV